MTIDVVVQSAYPWTAPNGCPFPPGESATVDLTPEVERDLDLGLIQRKVITVKEETPEPTVVEAPEEAPVTKPRASSKARTDSQES